jgi:hypothetical protein
MFEIYAAETKNVRIERNKKTKLKFQIVSQNYSYFSITNFYFLLQITINL